MVLSFGPNNQTSNLFKYVMISLICILQRWSLKYAKPSSFRPLHFIEFRISFVFQFFLASFLCFWHVSRKFGMKLSLFVNLFIAFLFPSHKHLGENLSKNSQLHTHPQWVQNFFLRCIYLLMHIAHDRIVLFTGVVQCITPREHSHMTSDVFWVFLTYLP